MPVWDYISAPQSGPSGARSNGDEVERFAKAVYEVVLAFVVSEALRDGERAPEARYCTEEEARAQLPMLVTELQQLRAANEGRTADHA